MILVDLFTGCGGFSLGAHRAGFAVASAYDIDATLTSSFAANFPNTKLVLADISTVLGAGVLAAAGGRVDGIFGGPPCQGFSDIGRRDVNDPRRQLLGHFFRLVNEVRPKFFVMENVKGLAYSDAREVLNDALAQLGGRYAVMGPTLLDAADFGAATKRKRLFVIGVSDDLNTVMTVSDLEAFKRAPATVADALADLKTPTLLPDVGDGFDRWRINRRGPPNAYAKRMRSVDRTFTGHKIVEHRADVASRFDAVAPGSMDKVGRHPRLKWSGQCPTLRAGTGSDKGSYQAVRPLHPDEPRVITVREAARLQGFPDDHIFHPTTWHSFRMIGNSVSPIISEAIFSAIAAKLGLAKETEAMAA
jgi:DNA (cytosine-5)-methyltransferase 1